MNKYIGEEILLGDCRELLKDIPDNSVDMVFTSPPYANRRKSTYGGTDAEHYVDWFMPIAKEIKRILKPTGSFFLNIKPHTDEGERDLYVFDLVCAIRREIGMLFIDEYCWTKTPFPGKLYGRFKNAFEPIYHFTKSPPNKITFNPQACATPMKQESIARAKRGTVSAPKNGSGMTGNNTNMQFLKVALPSNVINVHNTSTQHSDKKLHPATFPEGLVEFFVKSFTDGGGAGIGPVCGKRHNRNSLQQSWQKLHFNGADARIF